MGLPSAGAQCMTSASPLDHQLCLLAVASSNQLKPVWSSLVQGYTHKVRIQPYTRKARIY